jgi:DNA uptake protein ComE-like DNA-binding protein
MVNLNSASKEQIERLPGVTPETADKIIAGRPFKSTNELVSKKILAESEYKKIHSKVTVKHT